MELKIVPFGLYRAPYAGCAEERNSLFLLPQLTSRYLFGILCVTELRIALGQQGLDPSLVFAGRVSKREDLMTGAQAFYLDRGTPAEVLLFEAKITVRSLEERGRRREMFCAEVRKPAVAKPENPGPQRAALGKYLCGEMIANLAGLRSVLAEKQIILFLICCDTDQTVFGARHQHGTLSGVEISAIQFHIALTLQVEERKIRVHNLSRKLYLPDASQFGISMSA